MIEEKQTNELRLFSKGEIAELLGCSAMTVHRLIREKKLGHYRIGSRVMIPQKHLDAFLIKCERTPKTEAA
ncbi:MAG TPA: helix-turn-helix domain-containing protein [Pyrinomonadaceae bacterium]|nr:helix-turn-helix domain-containing protein [Pyrinomonadaceae bacterium]